jgi:hypothetical protein
MWRAIAVFFCFPGAQRRLTTRRADRKGAQWRWIGPVTGTTLIAGTRVSNYPYKTTTDVNWSLQEFLQVWSSRIQKYKDRFTVLCESRHILCVPVSCWTLSCWTLSVEEVWLTHTAFRESVALFFVGKFTGNNVIYCLPVWGKHIALISVSVLKMTFAASFKLRKKIILYAFAMIFIFRFRQVCVDVPISWVIKRLTNVDGRGIAKQNVVVTWLSWRSKNRNWIMYLVFNQFSDGRTMR